MIDFVLPLEPVAWQRVKIGKSMQSYVPSKTERFKREVAILSRPFAPKSPLEGPIELGLTFFLKPPKRSKPGAEPVTRPDLDNYCKGVLDALNQIFWRDDSQVIHLTARKTYVWIGEPRIRVTVLPHNQTWREETGQGLKNEKSRIGEVRSDHENKT